MNPKEPEHIDDQVIDGFMKSLALEGLRERFKIKPEEFKTKLDLQCYLIALQITATDKDFFIPISGKPRMGKSTLGMWLGIKTKESLRKDFHVEISEFDVEKDIHYPPISEKDLFDIIENEKPAMMMFDRVIFSDTTLKGIGVNPTEMEDFREGTCIYFSNMKTRKRGYNKFENEVKDTFQKSFIYDLIFTNPLMLKKNYKEFCDILINFYDSGVICQCKECNVEDPDRLIKATIIDGVTQLKTSLNRAKTRSVDLFMVNSVKIYNDYNFSDVKEIYPILIVNKKFPFMDYPFLKTLPEFNKINFVPIILSLDDLKFLVTELDTPSDLFAYFKKREEFLKKENKPFQNERELLAYYLLNNRSFEPTYVDSRSGIIIGFYEEYKKGYLSDLFVKRRELNKISYWIDDILKGAYLSYEPNYLKAIEEILKLDRIHRRQLAQRAEEKRNAAIKESRDAWGLTVYKENMDTEFVVYFTPNFNEDSYHFFQVLCMTVEFRMKVKKVVGIAQTVPKSTSKPLYTMGFYYEKKEDYNQEDEKELRELCDKFWGKESEDQPYWEFK